MSARRCWLSVVALALTSCGVPLSVQPLVPPNEGVLDRALLGTWEGSDSKGEHLTLSLEVKSGAVLRVTLPRGSETPVVLEAHACKLGDTSYLNARFLDEGEPSHWLIVRYQVAKDGTLTLWTMDDAPVREALAAGTLKGKSAGDPPDYLITDSVEKLRAFVRTHGVFEMFGKFNKRR